MPVLAALACSGNEPDDPVSPTTPGPTLRLDPVQHAVRASIAIRGVRPSVAELDAVLENPAALEGLVDTWLETDEFGETVKDLHAELFLIRADTTFQLPVMGLLAEKGYSQADLFRSTTEAPLELVREVVAQDLPYTDILTAPYTVANEVVADIYGLPFDPDGPEWQHTVWTDGRPQSGLLSDSEMWRRHVSNAANFHRGRANFVSRTFLCEDIGGRDVFVDGGVDISDPLAVATAVSTNTGCLACHNALDPMAAFWWGYKEQLKRGAIIGAYQQDCEWNWANGDPPRGSYRLEHWCYPLRFYDVEDESGWETYGLRPPAFFGQPARDMTDLGHMLAEDPRFAECAGRNFYGYLTQSDRYSVSLDTAIELRKVLETNGFSAKALVKAIVLSEGFATVRAEPGPSGAVADHVPLQTLRPEQLARTVYDLTGFRWLANEDARSCGDGIDTCWHDIDLTTSDLYGFRAMQGGLDGYTVTHPTHTPTPVKLLTMRKLAQEAAGFVVGQDFAAPAADRRLLRLVEDGQTDEAAVREQLVFLHLRMLGEVVDSGAGVDATYALFTNVSARSGDPREAWRAVIAALLQDPSMVLY